MVESQFFWKNQKLLAPEKYGARDCFVLKSMSGSQDQTHYDSITSWIDSGIFYPVHVVKMLRGRNSRRNSFTMDCGRSAALGLRAKWRQRCRQARLLDAGNRRGSGKAHLGRKDFDIGPSSAQGKKEK